MFSVAPLALIAVTCLSRLTEVSGHGGVLYYQNAGNWYTGWQPYNTPVGQTSIQRPWSTYDPITDATNAQLACNDDGTSGALQLTATVAAGSAITAYWNQVWPHPYGPMTTYLAQCPGSTCTGVNAKSLSWFKIDQAGLLSGTIANGQWGAGKMIAQNNSWTSTIPSSVPSGNYLIRFETIALHSLPAVRCILITGGGNTPPSSSQLVKFPGAYSNSDPGLTTNLYSQEATTETTYIIPGPPLYGSSSGGGGSNPPTSSHPSSSTVPPTSSSTVAAPPTQTGTAAHYAQCGGIGYDGPTVCAAPYSCVETNEYYSQCL